jgi:glucose/arabinose dehydrogenase
MKTSDICVFLTAYTLTVAFAAVAELWRGRNASALLNAIIAMLAVAATTVVGFYIEPGTSYLRILAQLISERDVSALASLGLGLAAGLAWIARLSEPATARTPAGDADGGWARRAIAQMILAASLVGVVLCAQAFIWKAILGVQRDPAARVQAPGFVIDKIADLEFLPIRVAASDNGRVYVSYDYFETWGTMGGAIVELSRDADSDSFRTKIVADSTLLMRSYGLVARGDDLYVSRTGICARATHGDLVYESTGAVTQLRDLDGDGYFEYLHDILTGLPGARGPDTMQQNNGISFAPDGSLFVTVAAAANRSLDEHPWAGTVLRVSPDLTSTEVFATGFRNPFGIAIGPDSELFVTDNDVDENPGDELNHVVAGAHYGHPYVVPQEPGVEANGFRDPILLGELESNFLGIAYATSPNLPEEYRNCLYMTDFMQNRILRLTLERSGNTYRVTGVHPFASLSSPVDIAVNASGEFFVTSRRTQNVYRIRPRRAASGADHG